MKSFEKKLKKRFFKGLDESLALLEQVAVIEPSDLSIESLLAQCVDLCQKYEQSQEPLRCIVHFGLPVDSPLFSSLEMMANTRILRLEGENFLDDLRLSYQQCKQLGQRLLVFCDYFLLERALTTDLLSLLKSQFKVQSLVVVTDSVDSYAVYCDIMQADEGLLNFEDYCQCILDINSELLVIRYEDFLGEPEKVMRDICKVLKLVLCEDLFVLKEVFTKKNQEKIYPSLLKPLSKNLNQIQSSFTKSNFKKDLVAIKRVFVLCTGRCGSTTFAKACSHFTNFTSGHETRARFLGEERFNYPDQHIEIDNRLSWFLGQLDEKFDDEETFYVHLVRNEEDIALSHLRRWDSDFLSSIIKAYGYGILMVGNKWSDKQKMDVCRNYVTTVNTNIKNFLKNKNHIIVDIEKTNDFKKFMIKINAKTDLDVTLDELSIRYNMTEWKKI